MTQGKFEPEAQQKINRILRFFSREESSGVLFAVAEDERMISSINRELVDRAGQDSLKVSILFLEQQANSSLLEQIAQAKESSQCDGLIIANLDRFFPKTEISGSSSNNSDFLTELNFGREALHRLDIPILFWVSSANFPVLQRLAPDLFSQRALSTVFFEMDPMGIELPKLDFIPLEMERHPRVLSEQEAEKAHNRVKMLLKQQEQALKSNQPRSRIAVDIVLPLAAELAKLDDPKALELLLEYEGDFDPASAFELAERGRILFRLKEYERAEPLMERAVVIYSKEGKTGELLEALLALGDILLETNKLEEAILIFEQYLLICEDLKERQENRTWLYVLMRLGLKRLGKAYWLQDNHEKALESFRKDVELSRKLHEYYPSSERFKSALAISYATIGATYSAIGKLNEAFQSYQQAKSLLDELVADSPQNVQFKQYLDQINQSLQRLESN